MSTEPHCFGSYVKTLAETNVMKPLLDIELQEANMAPTCEQPGEETFFGRYNIYLKCVQKKCRHPKNGNCYKKKFPFFFHFFVVLK